MAKSIKSMFLCYTDEIDDDLDEIDRYISMKTSFFTNETILQWWNKHSLTFPQLSLLANSLFGIPASSATAERIFSASGRILEKRRQSLNPEKVDDILMIRNFPRYVIGFLLYCLNKLYEIT